MVHQVSIQLEEGGIRSEREREREYLITDITE